MALWRRMGIVWFLLYTLLYCHEIAPSSSYFPEPSWWKIIQGNPSVNEILSPISRSKLTPKQQSMVARQPAILPVLIDALKQASKECNLQFRHRRWNCTLQLNASQPVFGPVSQRGCRETAFLYAIISAALTQSVAKACSKGKLKYCDCDPLLKGPSGFDWEWSNCSDNIRYAYKFVKKFTMSSENGDDIRTLMNKHNNEAGSRFISTLARTRCICNGGFASCSRKVCTKVAPNLRIVGEKLFAQFHVAKKIIPHNFDSPYRRKRTGTYQHGNGYHLEPTHLYVDQVRKKDLIYFEDSPNVCLERPEWVKNRRCNRTSLLVDGCDLMCCNGNYRTVKEKVERQCNCRFIYCCRVECQTCFYEVESSYCR